MELNQFSRTELIIGSKNLEKLNKLSVIVFGVGGVGGYVIEALARSNVGSITIVDNDKVALTNINRQIIATLDTVGLDKVDVMEKRIKSINPACNVTKYKCFYLPNNNDIDLTKYDYVIDAIDTISAKIDIIEKCYKNNIKVISSMGMGNKIEPTKIEVADIYKTSVCPLARVMRYELKKRGVKKLKVVYSKEEPIKSRVIIDEQTNKKVIPGSIAFVPSVAGLIIASEVIKDIINE